MYPRLHDVAIKGKDYSEVFLLDVGCQISNRALFVAIILYILQGALICISGFIMLPI